MLFHRNKDKKLILATYCACHWGSSIVFLMNMIGMSIRKIGMLVACFALAQMAYAETGNNASRVGMATPLAQGDSSNHQAEIASPIAEYADRLTESSSEGGGFMPEMPKNVTIDNEGEIIYDSDANTINYIGAPRVHLKTDNNIEIYAKRADVDINAKTVTMTGDVAIYQKNELASSLSRGDKAIFHYDSKKLHTEAFKSKANGMILRSGEFHYNKDKKGRSFLEGHDASVTSEDDESPMTWIGARRIRIYPDDSMEFKDMTCHYGGIPFFYFPYFIHSLNPDEGYMPVMGASTYLGAFMLNKYGILFGNRRVKKHRPSADYLLTTRLDYRSRRGMGSGIDVTDVDLHEKFSDMSGLSLYGVHDTDPMISPVNEPRTNVSKDRWRIALQQMWKLPVGDTPRSQWRLKTNINALSDAYMLRDFYKDMYQRDAEPDNTIAITRTGDTTIATLLQRFAPNNYYMTDQRTEMSFDRIRTTLFGSKIVYESENSAGFMRQVVPGSIRMNIQRELSDPTLSQTSREFYNRMLETNGFFRIHTFHELSTSYKVANFINLTPKIGGGYTGYYDVGDLGDFNQGIFYTGIDSDIKFSRRYNSIKSRSWGLNGVNHIVQPYCSLAYIGANELDPLCPRIDGYTPSTNPVAMSVGRITEIDSLASSSIFRYGLKNFLMTKRDQGSLRWLSWDVFMDAYLHDTIDDRKFSNMYSQLYWAPLPWMSYSSTMQLPVIQSKAESTGYHEYNHYFTFMPCRSTDVTIGHRYLSGHSTLEDSSQMDMRILYRVSEELALGASWRFELLSGTTDIQEYNVYKNMGAWYMGVGAYIRKNGGKNEVGVGFSFMLKESGTYLPVKFY